MWLFTRYGFYSVARATTAADSDISLDPDPVMVRARSRVHLESLRKRFNVLAGYEIREWPSRDYRFRLIVGKEIWVAVIAELAREQTWSNFKDKVASSLSSDHQYIQATHEVWNLMRKLQEGSSALRAPELATRAPESSRSVLDEVPLPDIIWDGITRLETLTEEGAKLRQDLANYTKDYNWPKVLSILSEYPELVNVTRPGGHSLYTPLHQAADGGADVGVVTQILKLGAWRTLRTSEGNRPVDLAQRKSHLHLQKLLEPAYAQDVPPAILARIQYHFHEVIQERAARLVVENALRLPELEVMLELRPRKFWFAVPGMCGGFAYWLAYDGPSAKLICESWSRVVGGSGQRHEITASGAPLVDEGFA